MRMRIDIKWNDGEYAQEFRVLSLSGEMLTHITAADTGRRMLRRYVTDAPNAAGFVALSLDEWGNPFEETVHDVDFQIVRADTWEVVAATQDERAGVEA